MQPIYFDLTELVANPLRTGIQRVERTIMRHWPGPRPLVPCAFESSSGNFVTLPNAVKEILSSDDVSPGDEEKQLLAPHVARRSELRIGQIGTLFNAEVFFDSKRARAYRSLARTGGVDIPWLIYDFVPYLYPEYYPLGKAAVFMHYILAMQQVTRASFISHRTRQEFILRAIKDEKRAGPVLPLGGDSIPIEKRHFNAESKVFVALGTIEPRKNIGAIMLAFEALWKKRIDAELIIIGRLDSRSEREAKLLERLCSEPRFRYLGHASDGAVRTALQSARATLYVSTVEGFGVPPYESLAAGIPVIAASGLPSLELLPPGGRILVETITPEAIEHAVVRLLDNKRASELWTEAANLRVPTWREFVQALADWLHNADKAIH